MKTKSGPGFEKQHKYGTAQHWAFFNMEEMKNEFDSDLKT